jgi:hypothetical protein
MLGTLVAVGTTIGGWIFGRSKVKAEVEKVRAEAEMVRAEVEGKHIKNFNDALEIWQGIVFDLREEVNLLRGEVSMLRKENFELKEAYEKLLNTINAKID